MPPARAREPVPGPADQRKLTAHGRYLVDNIASATAAMGHLFDALLNISRLDAGVIEPGASGSRSIRCWSSCGPVCAAGVRKLVAAGQASKAVVNSDPVLLERILQSHHRAYPARVLVGYRHRRGGVRILVCDTGPGIPAGAGVLGVPPAEQPGAGSQQGAGTGAGHRAAHRRAAGPSAGPGIAGGRGTLFSLGLETRSAEELATPPQSPRRQRPPPATRSPDHGRGRMVLVVDDDAQNLAGLTLLLEAGATASWAPPAC